jgi:hypothetical protein
MLGMSVESNKRNKSNFDTVIVVVLAPLFLPIFIGMLIEEKSK